MWEQLRPADIERAKRQLAIQRGETLKRHAEELKTLDADEAEIQTFERLVAAFVSKHISPSAQATLTSEESVMNLSLYRPYNQSSVETPAGQLMATCRCCR